MSNSLNTYTEKQLAEAKQNLITQIKRIDAEMASRARTTTTTTGGKKSAKSKSKSDSEESESDESESEKKVRAPKKKKEAPASKKDDDDDAKEKPIKATIASMKEVLTYHEIDFPSKASKDELCDIVRKNRLVRECEKKESNKKSAK